MFSDPSVYLLIKHLHITCAVLSIGMFFIRGAVLVAGSDLPRRRWARRLTDSVDSALLATAIALMVLSRQYPFGVPWLTAKLIGVSAYIGLGIVAFRFAPDWQTRLLAWLSALVVAAFVISVAITRAPWGFFV